jgi:putative transposase
MEASKPTLSKEFLSQFKNEKDLTEFFTDLYKQAINQMLEGEMDAHLGYGRYERKTPAEDPLLPEKNYRNGKSDKQLKTTYGKLDIQVPRDRNSSFTPQLVKKRQTALAKVEDTVLSLYSKGMSTRDIEQQIKELYGVELSEGTVSRITSRMLHLVSEWQERPLQPVYLMLWLDALRFHVRQDHKVICKSCYLAIGLNQEGKKELLGIWLSATESASFWLQVLTDIKARGVQDVLLAATDNLNGLPEAVEAVFSHSLVQVCLCHQIRNSLAYVAFEERKEFAADLKLIYQAASKEVAENYLLKLEEKWSSKYPQVVKSWFNNWERLSVFFDFPQEIRRLIYTTNIIESLNSMVRKYTRNKTVYPDDQAVLKSVYLALEQIGKKWTMPIAHWQRILAQFAILYPDRVKLNL